MPENHVTIHFEPMYTAAMFAELRFDDCRAELWGGSVLKRPFHGWQNGVLIAELGRLLGNWAERTDSGSVAAAVGWHIKPYTVLSPPLAFLSKQRRPQNLSGFPILAPDLVIEFEPHGGPDKLMAWRRAKYLRNGARAFWLVDADARTVHVYTSPTQVRILSEADTLDGGDVLSGFSCSVREIFSVL